MFWALLFGLALEGASGGLFFCLLLSYLAVAVVPISDESFFRVWVVAALTGSDEILLLAPPVAIPLSSSWK